MTNPTEIVITSPDYTALEADGVTPRITKLVAIVSIEGSAPGEVDLGKPEPAADGFIRISLVDSGIMDMVPMFGGTATISVIERGPGGDSLPSATIAFVRQTAPSAPSVSID